MGKRYFSPITWLNLRRNALKVTKSIGKLGSVIQKCGLFCPLVIGHVTLSICAVTVPGEGNVIRLSHI